MQATTENQNVTKMKENKTVLPLYVIVTKVSKDECLNNFCEESYWEPEVSGSNEE